MDISEIIHLFNIGEFGRVEDECRKLIEDIPNHPQAIIILTKTLQARYRYADALGCIEPLSKVYPGNTFVLDALGKLYFDMGRINDAITVLRTVIRIDPNFTSAHFNLGLAFGSLHSPPQRASADVDHEDFYAAMNLDLAARQDAYKKSTYHFECDVIPTLLRRLEVKNKWCVDIGASIPGSNSLPLFRDGWSGVCIEGNRSFSAGICEALNGCPGEISIVNTLAYPKTIASLLDSLGTPEKFGFLTLDIDGYDYDIADALLSKFRPSLICVEINERCGPTVKYALHCVKPKDIPWGKVMFGVSINMYGELFEKYGYGIVHLEYNNLFAVPREILRVVKDKVIEISVEKAWRDGFINRPDQLSRFRFNLDGPFQPLYDSPPEAMYNLIKGIIEPYREKCTLKL